MYHLINPGLFNKYILNIQYRASQPFLPSAVRTYGRLTGPKFGSKKRNSNTTELLFRKFICKELLYSIQINHQPDATIFQFIILTFIYSSTCFGRSPTHHQELNNCISTLLFYLRIGYITGPTTNTARPSPRYKGKTGGC